jgi:Fungal specific transcription factor domain
MFEHPQFVPEGFFLHSKKKPVSDPYHQEALQWYGRALSKTRAQLQNGSADVSMMLLTSVLFMCVELLQDHLTEAVDVYHSAVQLLSQHQGPQLESSILPIFWNLAMIVSVIGRSPYDWVGRTPLDVSERAPNGRQQPLPANIQMFSTIADARATIAPLVDRALILGRRAARLQTSTPDKTTMKTIHLEQQALKFLLDRWFQTFSQQGLQPERQQNTDMKFSSAALLMAHAAVCVVLETCLDPSEMANDEPRCISYFEQVVRAGQLAVNQIQLSDRTQPTLSLESSITLPLFVVVTKCRVPTLRREALELLRHGPRVEGVYKSDGYARAAKRIMELEEDGLIAGDDGTLHVPEHKRIRDTRADPTYNERGERVWLFKYTRREQDEDGIWKIKEETVPL